MSEHVFDDLPRLLSGEADRATVLSVAAHLRSCEDCRNELVSAVVAHAALTSAARHIPSLAIVSTEPAVTPAAVEPSTVPLPDLSSVFAQIRSEAAEPAAPTVEPVGAAVPISLDSRRRSIARSRLLVAAAIVGLAVGGGAVYAGERVSDRAPASQSVALDAFDKGTVPAKVTLVGGDEMKLDASALPSPGDGKLYEVWLTNSARTQMYAVGSLDAGRTATFSVSPKLMTTYSDIEVSVQPVDNSSYSGVSVLRGSY